MSIASSEQITHRPRSIRALSALLGASILATSCAGPAEEAALEPALEESEQALGEFGCATVAPHATRAITATPSGGEGAAATSPAAYTRPGCPNQWVVEFTGMSANRSYRVGDASLADLPVYLPGGAPHEFGQFLCYISRVEVGVYGFKDGAWSVLSLAKYHGEVPPPPQPGGLIMDRCQSRPDPGLVANPPVPPGYSKVRVAIKRYIQWTDIQYKPVTASLSWQPPVE